MNSKRVPIATALATGGLLVAIGAATATVAPVPEPAPRKHALIIAIAAYPEAGGYRPLHSDNDIVLIRTSLERQGFHPSDIHVLQDQDATREGILRVIRERLIEVAASGDVVVIHYSGHGHVITDDDGDEEDGYDEVLVPWDAPASMEGEYAGERHIRDDELNRVLAELRRKLGGEGHVLVTLDACHSGSATRGAIDLPPRGGLPPLGPPARRPGTRGVGDSAEGGGVFEPLGGTRAGSPGIELIAAAPLVVLSAARHDELSHEVRDADGTPAGALSLALSRVLAQGDPDETYRAFFQRLSAEMSVSAPLQTPQIEGAVDTRVFNGEAVEQAPHVAVAAVVSDSVVRLAGGTLVGLHVGAGVAIHPLGTADPSTGRPLATGQVRRANAVLSEVVLDEPLSDEALASGWAFITRPSFGDLRVRVALAPSLAGGARRAAEVGVEASGVALLTDSFPDLLVDADASGAVSVRAPAAGAAVGEPIPAGDARLAAELGDRILRYARFKFLRQMELKDPDLDVRVELLPAVHELDDFDGSCVRSDTLAGSAHLTDGGQWELRPGDGFLLRLVNAGGAAAHVVLLDLMPTGDVAQVYPHPQQRGEDNYLAAGATHLLKDLCFVATEPYGVEVLKLFATRQRVDFTPMLTPTGEHRGGSNLIEQLIGSAYGGTRAAVSALPTRAGNTYSLVLRIIR